MYRVEIEANRELGSVFVKVEDLINKKIDIHVIPVEIEEEWEEVNDFLKKLIRGGRNE